MADWGRPPPPLLGPGNWAQPRTLTITLVKSNDPPTIILILNQLTHGENISVKLSLLMAILKSTDIFFRHLAINSSSICWAPLVVRSGLRLSIHQPEDHAALSPVKCSNSSIRNIVSISFSATVLEWVYQMMRNNAIHHTYPHSLPPAAVAGCKSHQI